MGKCLACATTREHHQNNIQPTKKHKIYDINNVKKPLVYPKEQPKTILAPSISADNEIVKCNNIQQNIQPISAPNKIITLPTPPTLLPVSEEVITCIEENKPIDDRKFINTYTIPVNTVKNNTISTTPHSETLIHIHKQTSIPLPSISSMSKALIVQHPSNISLISNTEVTDSNSNILAGYTPFTCTHTIHIPIINDGPLPNAIYDPISAMKSAPLPIIPHWRHLSSKKDTSTPSWITEKLSVNNRPELKDEESNFIRPIPINKDILLIYGYVRIITMEYKRRYGMKLDTAILPKHNAILIFDILFGYFRTLNMLFCLDDSKENIVYIADMNDLKTNFKCSIRNIYDINTVQMYSSDVDNVGLTHCNNIILPDNINNLLYKYDKHYNPMQNSFIFKCGCKSTQFGLNKQFECSMLIINEEQLQRGDDNNIGYYWELPCNELPIVDFNSIVYSANQKCLYCVGGTDMFGNITSNFWKLSFDKYQYFKQDLNEWKWMKMANMEMPRSLSSCLMINHNKLIGEYLCVLGGYNNQNNNELNKDILLDSVEIFDFNEFHYCWKKYSKIKNMNYARCASGCYFQDSVQKIFIGGGTIENSKSNKIEYCDLIKNKWYDLCDTNMEHKHYPTMWIENNYLLNIVSTTANGMECIDLRDSKNKWQVLYSREKNMESYELSQLFDLEICPFTFMNVGDVDQYKYRLIK